MSRLKVGVVKIKEGVKTIFSPTLKKYWEQYQRSSMAKGSQQIADGFKHLFGYSEAQQRKKFLDALTMGCKDEHKPALRQIIDNIVAHQHSTASNSSRQQHDNILLPLAIRTFTKMIAPDLFGVQPMQGPVGVVYKLESKKSGMEIVKHSVEARTKRLSGRWTLEQQQDLNALHGVDIEVELIKALSAETALEFDSELLAHANALAKELSNPKSVADGIEAAKARGVDVNWIVMNPEDSLKLISDADFKSVKGELYVGTYKDIPLYVHESMVPKRVLIGRKGETDLDSSLIFCPYVLVMSSGVVVDPTTFAPQISLMTRFGIHASEGRSDYMKFNLN